MIVIGEAPQLLREFGIATSRASRVQDSCGTSEIQRAELLHGSEPSRCGGRGSVMPVCSFMDDFPADHSYRSGNVAQPSVIDGERIGGQDSEVRQFAGLQ